MPDGVFSKKLNIDKALNMGWEPEPIKSSLNKLIKKLLK